MMAQSYSIAQYIGAISYNYRRRFSLSGGRTGCRSVAASALQRAYQKRHDLAREAVGCNGVFGALVAVARVATSMCRPLLHTITPSTTGVRSLSRASGITRRTTSLQPNHADL